MAKTTFLADVSWSGEGVRSTARIRNKEVVIDEPASLGGTDQGPNPVELILAALGGCLNVLVTSLAPHHQVDVRGVRIRVEGDLDPDGYTEKNPNVRPGFQEIRYDIQIDSPSPPENIRALIEHVERVCPVKDTLRGVPTVAVTQ
ncbi:MAG: OsmC family protein [Alicyclobacillaceae bacterium]|nr:OsmC family protein [Alicyclobacillaceae bacterium]